MPLMMRRSSSRSGPVSPVGRCGSIRAHCLSFSQNKPARTLSPPNQEHIGKRITWRYLGTDPNVFAENTARMGLFREGRSLPASANRAWSERHESFAFRLHPARCWLRRRTADSEMKPPGGGLDRTQVFEPQVFEPQTPVCRPTRGRSGRVVDDQLKRELG